MPIRRVSVSRPKSTLQKFKSSVNDDGAYVALSGKHSKKSKPKKLTFGSKHKRR